MRFGFEKKNTECKESNCAKMDTCITFQVVPVACLMELMN